MAHTSDTSVPTHLGIILDGNRRWAREQGLPTFEGHRKGYENLKTISRAAFKKGIKYVSAYAFSTENWNRTKEEVDYLMGLALKIATKDAKELTKENICIKVFGVEDRVDPKIIKAWREVEEVSQHNTGGVLAVCFNYSGQREIADAVRSIVRAGTPEEEIDIETVSQHIYHPDVPPIDLMIRTSGEQRISNFMLWRMAYAEMCFVKMYWPAFTETDLSQVLEDYTQRHRRFGGN